MNQKLRDEAGSLPAHERFSKLLEPYTRSAVQEAFSSGDEKAVLKLTSVTKATAADRPSDLAWISSLAELASGVRPTTNWLKTIPVDRRVYVSGLTAVAMPEIYDASFSPALPDPAAAKALSFLALKLRACRPPLKLTAAQIKKFGDLVPDDTKAASETPSEKKMKQIRFQSVTKLTNAESAKMMKTLEQVRGARAVVMSEVPKLDAKSRVRVLRAAAVMESSAAKFIETAPLPAGLTPEQITQYKTGIAQLASEFTKQQGQFQTAEQAIEKKLGSEVATEKAPAVLKDAKQLWKELAETPGKYETSWAIGASNSTPLAADEVSVPTYCYAQDVRVVQELPAPETRVYDQAYLSKISYEFWGTGSPIAVSDQFSQTPIHDTPALLTVQLDFWKSKMWDQGRKPGDAAYFVSKLPPGIARNFGYAGLHYPTMDFESGAILASQTSDLDVKILSADPVEKTCTSLQPFGPDNFYGRLYWQKNTTTTYEFKDRFSGLTATTTLQSKSYDHNLDIAGHPKALRSFDLTAPIAPSVDPRCAAGAGLTPFAAGNGSRSDPWLICNLQQLKNMKLAKLVDPLIVGSGTSPKQLTDVFGYFQLGANIDVGTLGPNDTPLKMMGLDGAGYWLNNFLMTDAERQISVFQSIAFWNPGYVKNLNFDNLSLRALGFSLMTSTGRTEMFNVDNVYLQGAHFYGVGAPIGMVGNVDNVRSVGAEMYIDGDGSTVGLAGIVSSATLVTNSYFGGIIKFMSPGYIGRGVAGIASNASAITDCRVEADFRLSPAPIDVGGIVGTTGRAERNYFKGAILGTSTGSIGGIVGRIYSGLLYANKVEAVQIDIAGSAGALAGYVGSSTGVLENEADGMVSGRDTVGGLIGSTDWGQFENNRVAVKAACTNPGSSWGGCGAFIGSVKHLPNCPTLPDFTSNVIQGGTANGLSPIGSGPLGNRVAPVGITGDIVPGS